MTSLAAAVKRSGIARMELAPIAARRALWRLEAYNPETLRGLIGAARARASALVRRGRSR